MAMACPRRRLHSSIFFATDLEDGVIELVVLLSFGSPRIGAAVQDLLQMLIRSCHTFETSSNGRDVSNYGPSSSGL